MASWSQVCYSIGQLLLMGIYLSAMVVIWYPECGLHAIYDNGVRLGVDVIGNFDPRYSSKAPDKVYVADSVHAEVRMVPSDPLVSTIGLQLLPEDLRGDKKSHPCKSQPNLCNVLQGAIGLRQRPYLVCIILKLIGEGIDIPKYCHAGVGESLPAWHGDHQGGAWVCEYVSRVHGQRT
eukprot:scaffold16108_cov42-Prasinocladus_malaysianus.AAC.1